MKYKIGDMVISLLERGTVKEGDVGCIDAIHKDNCSYTVGFYATEDALLYSGRFREEELRPHVKNEETALYEEGDVVELLVDMPSLPKGSVGEIVSLISPGVYAASFAIESMTVPLLVPVQAENIRKLGHHESPHSHHH